MKKMIVASTSTLHGGGFLEYLIPRLTIHFQGISQLLFIPYARPGGISHDAYTEIVQNALKHLNFEVKGIHEFADPLEAIKKAEAFYVGGGNTFVLVDTLHKNGLMDVLREEVQKGKPYLGSSAGSNIIGPSVKTTNDMPIVQPPSLDSLGLLPYNLNPHYLDPDPSSTHKGETRETRIKEFHVYNDTRVIGLREGSWIEVEGERQILRGPLTARIFDKNKEASEFPSGTDFSTLLA
ncbi:dipeptidase PepE [Lutimonas sp.]|uniref:dipeptidase PepE n=1 Tax=Lutimonas sp. TaxID=1872403 RepID=UPI003D9ADE09